MSIKEKMSGTLTGEQFNSSGNERETPWEFFWRLDNEFHFTLDPCASHKNHKCERYFTKTTDGLKRDWSNEVVFVNPPYGRELQRWVKKSYEESLKGATVVMLIPLRSNNIWWHDYCMKAHEVRLLRKRLKFIDEQGIPYKHGLPFPLALVIFRPKKRKNNNPQLLPYEAFRVVTKGREEWI